MASYVSRVKLNPKLLVWARCTAGYSTKDIADKFHFDEARILSWENGEDSPSIRQLEQFASWVGRPLAALFLPEPPVEAPLPEDFRVLPGTVPGEFAPEMLLMFRRAADIQETTIELMETMGIGESLCLPSYSTSDDPEKCGPDLRSKLGISIEHQENAGSASDVLRLWRELLFEYGVVVTQLPFSEKNARAFSLQNPRVSIVALSTKDATEARIFSLFHELCHLCINKPGVSGGDARTSRVRWDSRHVTEDFCDRFSAAFLLPASEPRVTEALSRICDAKLDEHVLRQVARRFRVSKYVVLRRLLSLELVSDNEYWPIFNRWREEDANRPRSGGFIHHVEKIVNQHGIPFVSLVFDAVDRGLISSYEASGYLSLDRKWFDRARTDLFTGASIG